MVKGLESYELIKSTRHKMKIKVRTFPKATIRCMVDYIKPTIRNENPDIIVLHAGTNNLASDDTAIQICNDMINLASSIRDKGIKVVLSLIVPRNDEYADKAREVNEHLMNICKSIDIQFIHHENIQPDFHLNGSKLHLNKKGDFIFKSNFVKLIRFTE